MTHALVWRYYPASDTWEQLPSLREPRALCAATYLDGVVYVSGGVGAIHAVECLRVHVPGAEWAACAPAASRMQYGRYLHGLCAQRRATDGQRVLYAVGGDSTVRPTEQMLVFAPDDDSAASDGGELSYAAWEVIPGHGYRDGHISAIIL